MAPAVTTGHYLPATGTIFACGVDWYFTTLVLYITVVGMENAKQPAWFCFRGPWRAEFETLDGALTWCREHGGTVTQSPTNGTEPNGPTAGNIAMADLYGSSCGEE